MSDTQLNRLRNGLRIALVWCFILIAFGAFVRLSDAGLGCPDWPTCYGKATWPKAHEIEAANAAFPERAVEMHKTWPEQVHRHIAAGLGSWILLLTTLTLLATKQSINRKRDQFVLWSGVALIAAAVASYIAEMHVASGISFASGEALLLWLSLQHRGMARWITLTLMWICFQALLGMWTVTWLVKPIVVTAHLLGGLLTLALIFRCLQLSQLRAVPTSLRNRNPIATRWIAIAAITLSAQIFLGGWVSTNYAALACPDFPTCQGKAWPETDFREGFVLWRGIGVNYEGGILDAPARAAVHITHRIGALVASAAILWLCFLAWRARLRTPAAMLAGCLCVQVALGISNVVYALPLKVAVAHNAVAALLVLALMHLWWRNRQAHASGIAAL